MSAYLKNSMYKRFNFFMASVIAGQASLTRTLLVFSACALLLLLYVTTQIYAGVLADRIAELERKQLGLREQYHTLTGEHTKLASRNRVGGYCRRVLGMVEADSETMKRVAVDIDRRHLPKHGEFAVKRTFIPEALGYPGGPSRKD